MTLRNETILKWFIGVLLLFLFFGLFFPCTNCPGKAARRVEARNLIHNFDGAFRAYKEEYGSYPSGSPREIVSALTGNNSRSIEFIILQDRDRNQAGDPIDFWKTPFRFVRISESEPPQLTSAGPDRTFGTQDDVTLAHY